MDGYTDALELTVIALGALLVISICFIGLTRGLQWLARPGKKEEEIVAAEPEAPIVPAETPSVTPEAPPVTMPAATKPVPRIAGEGVITSPMPGTVIAIKVEVGELVKVGDVLIILESMKIQNEIPAPRDGRIKEIYIAEGKYVRRREPLIAIEG
ncbi:MAG: biotin/lipoyl-binding protein [Dehalococcoidia bacterium]|nr:biotin/lipoyl-binding protein [Dehalococcoidia bacterium]